MHIPHQSTARLQDKIIHNEKFVQYFFELDEPHRLAFTAGQYVSIKVSERGERRSYSICSSPAVDHKFELLLDLSPQGIGCKYLESLQFGDQLSLLGPLGMFVVPEQTTETAFFFIATGSGITPFRSMALDLLQNKHDTRPITLYWGLRYEQEMFWQDEFQELADNFPNFHFKIIISRPSEAWPLDKGRVTDLLTVAEKPAGAGYYLCGNNKMIEEVIASLAQNNVDKTHIHHEMFY